MLVSTNSLIRESNHSLEVYGLSSSLVQGPLEDESDITALSSQLLDAEWTGSVEGVRAVRQRDLAPEACRLLRAHVTTGAEGMSGWCGVQVERCLTAQPEGHVGAFCPAHGALALPTLLRVLLLGVAVAAPPVVAVDVSAAQVGPRLLLVQDLLAPQAGEGECVEAHGALGATGVQLLAQRLQVFDGGRARQALRRAPQEGGAAQVDKGAVHQLLGFAVHLRKNINRQSDLETPASLY